LLLIAGCDAPSSSGLCGESFCLPEGARLLSKQTPVEDFNLYQIAWRNARFSIYEGNAPAGWQGATGEAIRIPLSARAVLRTENGEGSLLIPTGKSFPGYLDVMGPCRRLDQCELTSFARQLHPLAEAP